ncbi:hypothetical protein JNL27_08845 [bacterium]|nr:hypothetical protein [bacterium]
MKAITFLYVMELGCFSFPALAQESSTVVYDYALLKREYIGKNEIFTIQYRNETGKTHRIDGYIRASADENQITVYVFNSNSRNYDLVEISLSSIQSIVRSDSQKTVAADKPRMFSKGSLLKAAGIVLISAGLALIIFHDKL